MNEAEIEKHQTQILLDLKDKPRLSVMIPPQRLYLIMGACLSMATDHEADQTSKRTFSQTYGELREILLDVHPEIREPLKNLESEMGFYLITVSNEVNH